MKPVIGLTRTRRHLAMSQQAVRAIAFAAKDRICGVCSQHINIKGYFVDSQGRAIRNTQTS